MEETESELATALAKRVPQDDLKNGTSAEPRAAGAESGGAGGEQKQEQEESGGEQDAFCDAQEEVDWTVSLSAAEGGEVSGGVGDEAGGNANGEGASADPGAAAGDASATVPASTAVPAEAAVAGEAGEAVAAATDGGLDETDDPRPPSEGDLLKLKQAGGSTVKQEGGLLGDMNGIGVGGLGVCGFLFLLSILRVNRMPAFGSAAICGSMMTFVRYPCIAGGMHESSESMRRHALLHVLTPCACGPVLE